MAFRNEIIGFQSLQQGYAYAGGAIQLSTTGGAFALKDAATPISGDLLSVKNSAGTVTYFDISDTAAATITTPYTPVGLGVLGGIYLDSVGDYTASSPVPVHVQLRTAGMTYLSFAPYPVAAADGPRIIASHPNAAPGSFDRGHIIFTGSGISFNQPLIPDSGYSNQYDLGLSGSQWRTGYFATSVVVGGVTFNGTVGVGTFATPIPTVRANNFIATYGSGTVTVLYANSGGSDTTGTGAVGAPYRSLARLLKDVPSIISNAWYVANVTGLGTETNAASYYLPACSSQQDIESTGSGSSYFPALAPLTIVADPTTVQAVTITSHVNNIDRAGLSRVTVTETLGGFVAGQFLYTSAGTCCPIIAQPTANTLDVASTAAGDVANGAAIIGTPSATIESSTSGQFAMIAAPSSVLQISGIKFSHTTATSRALRLSSAINVQMNGCDIQGLSTNGFETLQLRGCYLHMSASTNTSWGLAVARLVMKACYWKNWNWGANHTCAIGATIINDCAFDGCRGFGIGAVSSPNGFDTGSITAFNCLIVNSPDYGFNVSDGNSAYLSSMAFGNNTSGAVGVTGNARAMLKDAGNSTMLTSTTNGGKGVTVTAGGQVEMAGTASVVTGSGGDLIVGNRAARTWTDFYTTGAQGTVNNEVDIADGSRVFVAGAAAAASVVASKASASDSLLTGTGATDVATHTPSIAGNFLVFIGFRVVTGATNCIVNLTWTDGTGAQTLAVLPLTSEGVGTYTLSPVLVNSVASSAITVTVTAGTANQVYVSASILGVH